jgi:hypothetical protein
MTMDRRRFVREGLAAGALAVGTGGLLFVRQARARGALRESLLADALPPLGAKCLHELQQFPSQARDAIVEYFHGRCLNVQGFATNVCTPEFIERLGRCRGADEQRACLLHAFMSRVASDVEILNQVETIAAEAGAELDIAWADYCNELNSRWRSRIPGSGPSLSNVEFNDRLDRLIRSDLNATVASILASGQRPAVGETIGKIGQSALLLLGVLRDVSLGLTAGLPIFFLLAARPLWDFLIARLQDRRREYQTDVSARVAQLGMRVGAEFEHEVRLRLTDLHTWQERALRETARRIADERVGLM